MRDVSDSEVHVRNEHLQARDEDHDQVGTVEVQILLSWFFETTGPSELAIDLPHAA